ncbi:hypothetical protein BJ138DRAFT_1114171 [Hygrophoropsis aurantiaca]|uniref:Uncharacterized protein n=1 Tax=Hygrophoropsis aurantiaca TaxID=72124 RepID=A0ACB8ABC8_9AGAM|nr:hypothetical protein BJ138DRAFT_1114171 [Hygrophoropsis aurantiaca]
MAAIPNLSLIQVVGALQIGVASSSFLTGCLVIQTYVYYSKFPSDPCFLKIFVAILVLLEVTHLLCMAIAQWQFTLDTAASLVVFPYAADLVIVFSNLIFMCVQSFFILRLLKFSKNKYVALACMILCAGFTISGEVIAAKAFAMTNSEQYIDAQYVMIIASFILGTLCDLGITAGLMYHLFKLRKVEFRRTIRTVDTLMLWTLETGLIPCMFGLASLGCFIAMRYNFIWIAFYEVLASTYANACLAALNSRSITSHQNAINMLDRDPRVPKPSDIVVNISSSSNSTAPNDGKGEI